jgi:hypothetical protein
MNLLPGESAEAEQHEAEALAEVVVDEGGRFLDRIRAA